MREGITCCKGSQVRFEPRAAVVCCVLQSTGIWYYPEPYLSTEIISDLLLAVRESWPGASVRALIPGMDDNSSANFNGRYEE